MHVPSQIEIPDELGNDIYNSIMWGNSYTIASKVAMSHQKGCLPMAFCMLVWSSFNSETES